MSITRTRASRTFDGQAAVIAPFLSKWTGMQGVPSLSDTGG